MTSLDNNPNQKNQTDPEPSRAKNKLKMGVYVLFYITLLVIAVVIGKSYSSQDESEDAKLANDDDAELTKKDDKAKNSKANKANKEDKQPVLTVEVVSPRIGNVPSSIKTDGIIVAKNTSRVNGKIAGIAVNQVLVEEGDWVKKGQVLAVFDQQALEQNVIQSQAQLAQAQASFNNAKATVNRILPLLEIDAVSKQEVENYLTQTEQAKAGVVAAQASLNSQQIRLNDTQVLAPISGVISKKSISVGAIPQGALFEIIEGGMLEWQAKINPEKISQIKIGIPVVVQSANKQNLMGSVTRIDPVAGADRKISVYALLQANPQASVQSGMLLSGAFVLGNQPQQIVPMSSVASNDGYNYLVVVENVKKDIKDTSSHIGTVKRLKVEVGEQLGNAVVIKSMLPRGLNVIYQGGGFLSNGDVVRIAKTREIATQQQPSPATSEIENSEVSPSLPMARPIETQPKAIEADLSSESMGDGE